MTLVWLAIALAVLWIVGVATFELVGLAIHLALIAAVVLFAIWGFQRLRGGAANART